MTDTPDLDGLEKLAKAATPGPWSAIGGANSHVFDQRITSTKDEYHCVAFSDDADAAFIAAANPATVLALVSLARRAVPGGGETWSSMAAWTEETFGPVSLERIATRANEEMQELLADPSDVTEAADVCIVLSRYPGIEDAINRKMAINRKRQWRLNGDGSGYHVKPDETLAAIRSQKQ